MLRRTDHDQFIRALAVMMFPLGTDELTFNAFVRINRFAASLDVQEGYESFRFETATRSHLVRSPTLVLHRRDDQLVSFQSGRELAASIPGARFIPLEGSNHIPWTGDWQSVVEPILDFLLDEPEFAVAQTIPNAAGLSARELEVLHHLVAGKSNQQIADELVLSPNTVIRHVSNIFDKIGAANRTEAAALARKAGLAD